MSKDEIPKNCFMQLLEKMFCRHESDFLPTTDHREKLLWSLVHVCKVFEFRWNALNHSSAQHYISRGLDSRGDSGCLFTCFLVHNHGWTYAPFPSFSVSPLKELTHILIMSCAVTVCLMNSDFWAQWSLGHRDPQGLCGLYRQDRQSIRN